MQRPNKPPPPRGPAPPPPPGRVKEGSTNHWSQHVRECLVSGGPDGIHHLIIGGGAESGKFCFLGEVKQDSLTYHTANRLRGEDIVLELQGLKVGGFTLWDLQDWLKNVSKNGVPVMFKIVKAGLLTKDLREYLNTRFQKSSVDHDLQQIIRNNIYKRTVPCTTRIPKKGEINGVDYKFLNLEEFIALEKTGSLLESGLYDGNHYGTPKPPRSPSEASLSPGPLGDSTFKRTNSMGTLLPGQHASSEGKRRRNRSNIETLPKQQPSPGANSLDDIAMHKESTLTRKKSLERAQSAGNLGPLPSNWEMAYTEDGIPYFIDHQTETTHWLDPRLSTNMKMSPLECDENELPYGWEKVEDPHFGTYFIDHVNRKTQYENPVVQARRLAQDGDSRSNDRPPNDRNGDEVDGRKSPPAYGTLRPAFTKNPGDLKGQFLETELLKSQRGFGFTIIGADNSDEEFLQVKSIVPNGPAHADAKLKRGDVLVYINRQCVLGYTHQDVVSLFQSIQVGDQLHVRVCRGYLLPFDPDDPNTEIITTVAVSLPPVTMPTTKVAKGDNTEGEILSMHIVKGAMGFGFTIADSVYGQRVKQILDSQRCQRLQAGDLLVTINETNVRDLAHTEVVEVLKGCSRGQAAGVTVQRGGLPAKGRRSPKTVLENTYANLPISSHAQNSFSGSSDSISFNRHEHSDQSSLTPDMSRDHGFPSNRLRHSNPISATHSPQKSDQPDSARTPESRSRTPGPDFMRGRDRDDEPYFKRHNTSEMRSKTPTPQPGVHNLSGTPDFIPASHYQSPPHRSSARSVPSSSGFPSPSSQRPMSPVHRRQQTTSFEQEEPAHIARNTPHWETSPSGSLDRSQSPGDDKYMEMTVILKRQDNGFGFRIIGGTEEGSQVSVGDIVPGGAAEQDGRLRPGDEILYVEGQCVVGSSHHRVVQVMGHSASNGTVTLVVRRRLAGPAPSAMTELSVRVPNRMTDSFPYDVAVTRREDEGFGFVIISSRTRSGSVIGKIIDGSPAERCGNLRVGDRILAVNNINILRLHHEEIVNIIKDSGHSVTLTIGPPQDDASQRVSPGSMVNAMAYPAQSDNDRIPRPSSNGSTEKTRPLYNQMPQKQIEEEKFYAVELLRGSRGFGFSIRGGREFSNMPLYVLRIADGGAAHMDQRLLVGDQLIEINGYNTNNMTHAEAIELIQSGGSSVRLLIKRSSKSAVAAQNQRQSPSNGPLGQSSPLPNHQSDVSYGPHISRESRQPPPYH